MTEETLKELTALVGIAMTLWPFVANFLNAKQRERIEQVAATAVRAAEMYALTHPEVDKYSIALNEAKKMGKRHRANLHVDDWFPYIEEAVHELKQVKGELTTPVQAADNRISLR